MKILYIYKDYKGRRKQYGKLMERCGCQVKFLELRSKKIKNQINIKDFKKYNVDIVWFYSPFYIKYNEDFIDYLKSKKIPIILYGQYNPQVPYAEWNKVWDKIDILFVQNGEFSNYLKQRKLNSYYVPFGFHPYQYYKTSYSKKYDISFCGTALVRDSFEKDKRARYLRSLKNYDVHVFGESFKGKVDKISVKSYKTHDRQRKIYGQTKINLDLPFFHTVPAFYKDKFHIKNRLFEVPATGNFLLTTRCNEFLNIFDEDTIGYYCDNIDSLKDSIDKYLKDKKLRQKMTEKAYKLVHQKHTFLHRFKYMLDVVKNNF